MPIFGFMSFKPKVDRTMELRSYLVEFDHYYRLVDKALNFKGKIQCFLKYIGTHLIYIFM